MRTVHLKSNENGTLSVAPGATAGKQTRHRRVKLVIAITDVPEDVSDQEACNLASKCFFERTFGADELTAEQCSFPYAELGVGKILR